MFSSEDTGTRLENTTVDSVHVGVSGPTSQRAWIPLQSAGCTKPGILVPLCLDQRVRLTGACPFSHKLPPGDISETPAAQRTLWPLDLVKGGSRFWFLLRCS